MKTVTVQISMLPPRECNPNWRGHWRAKARAVSSFRNAAFLCALQATNYERPAWPKATVRVDIIVRDGRYYRDPDNTIASLKPAIDGCVQAGILLDDDRLHFVMPILYKVDKERAPLVILRFEELA